MTPEKKTINTRVEVIATANYTQISFKIITVVKKHSDHVLENIFHNANVSFLIVMKRLDCIFSVNVEGMHSKIYFCGIKLSHKSLLERYSIRTFKMKSRELY